MEGRGRKGLDRKAPRWSGWERPELAEEDGTGKDCNGCTGMVRNGRKGVERVGQESMGMLRRGSIG